MTRIVFDIGGTNMRVGRVHDERVTSVEKVPTPLDPNEAVQVLTSLMSELSAGDEIEAVAGGIPAVVSRNGQIYQAPHLRSWNGFHFGAAVRARIGVAPIVRNDTVIGALGEAMHGAGRAYDIVAYIAGGTGVGGSRVVRGRADPYAYGFEPGHHILDAATGATFEETVGGAAVERKYGAHPRDLPKAVWDELTPKLAQGLYTALLFWSPHVLVLGGSMFRDPNAFQLDALTDELVHLNTIIPELPDIRRGELGDAAGLWGALALLNQA